MENDKKRELCILIPTMNRPNCMEELLKAEIPSVNETGVYVYVYDTSSNDDTKRLVEKYNQEVNGHFLYYKHENYPDRTTDLKVINAFRELEDTYKYVWLSGDGCILKITEMLKLIQEYFDQDYDVIHFTGDDDSEKTAIEVYNQPEKLFADHGPFMTYYSATILSSAFIKQVQWEEIGKEYRNSGFLFLKGVFEGLANGNCKMAVVHKRHLTVNPQKKGNSSYGPGKFLKFWVRNWPDVVDSLPPCYDAYKNKVTVAVGERQRFYEMDNLILLRRTDNLNKKLFEEYRDGFSRVTNVSLKKIYFAATMPQVLVLFYRTWFYVKYHWLVKLK